MLKIYIVSTVISLLFVGLTIQAIHDQLKREGYVRRSAPSWADIMKGLLLCCIPILNVIIALSLSLNSNKAKEILKDDEFVKTGR